MEAHASGRKYRRANRPDATEFHRLTDTATDSRWLMPVENALATDYEFEPEAKLLTRKEVHAEVVSVLHNIGGIRGGTVDWDAATKEGE